MNAYFLEINSIPGMTNESIFPNKQNEVEFLLLRLCDEIYSQATYKLIYLLL